MLGLEKLRKMAFKNINGIKRDIVVIIGICALVLVLSAIDFGIPFNIKYLTTDASVHYGVTYRFYEEDTLLLKGSRKRQNRK